MARSQGRRQSPQLAPARPNNLWYSAAADIAGYSALMGADEARTVRDLKAHQAVILPMIAEHAGHVIDTAGDGVLAEFGSVVNAVECAVAIQRCLSERNTSIEQTRRMLYRIGINFGDVIHDKARVYGDGVNVAARLEAIAEPGGICIAEKVYVEIAGKINVQCQDIGQQQIKNIEQAVRVYRVLLDHAASKREPYPLLLVRPSIAVLPFQNASGDADADYFADGMVEEIITALSHFRCLFVIARNSSFTYKDRNVDAKQIGRELGVRYLLEGSVRRAGNRLRLTRQLIEAANGMHLWAQRFDGALTDVFTLQDQMTANVVGAIIPRLTQAEFERAMRKATESLEADDYYMRGLCVFTTTPRKASLRHYSFSVRLLISIRTTPRRMHQPPLCAEARIRNGWMSDCPSEIEETERLARRATELGRDDAAALAPAGFVLARIAGDLDDGAALIDRALTLNANLARAWQYSGWVRIWLGEPELAIEHATQAMRFSPVDPWLCSMQTAIAFGHFFAGRDNEACTWVAMALRERPSFQPALRLAAASNALAGRIEKAREAVAHLRLVNPALRLCNLKASSAVQRRPEFFSRYKEALRKAGLSE